MERLHSNTTQLQAELDEAMETERAGVEKGMAAERAAMEAHTKLDTERRMSVINLIKLVLTLPAVYT